MIQTVVCPNCRQTNRGGARYCTFCGHDVILNNSGPRYFLTRVIKEGGQGAVYEAVDEGGKVYAVKEMLDRFTDPQERGAAVARFQAEAETLRRLSHPRIPRVYASFHDEGRHYLVMDFIRGEDLDELVAREGPQPEARVLAWAAELCDVLSYLHGQDVIYRDLKPSNVMLEGKDLKLIDFGIAKVFQPATRGTQIGTPGYAPPEQYQGLATRVSDVYAFAATLHHLLTGRDPQQHPPFNFPPVRDLAPAVSARSETALARALQMRQEDRFQSVAELCAALLPAPAKPAAPPPAPTKPAPTKPAAPPPAPTKPVPTKPAAPPSAPAKPAALQPAAPQPAPAKPVRRGRWGLLLGIVAVLGALGYGAYLLLGSGLLATPAPGPTATSAVLVERSFVADEIELVVPSGSSPEAVDQAFAAAFLQLARLDCGCEPQLVAGSLTYRFGAEPRQLSIGPDGTRYSASLQARILVPG